MIYKAIPKKAKIAANIQYLITTFSFGQPK